MAPQITGISLPQYILYCKKVLSVGGGKSVDNLSVCICDPLKGHENLGAIDGFEF